MFQTRTCTACPEGPTKEGTLLARHTTPTQEPRAREEGQACLRDGHSHVYSHEVRHTKEAWPESQTAGTVPVNPGSQVLRKPVWCLTGHPTGLAVRTGQWGAKGRGQQWGLGDPNALFIHSGHLHPTPGREGDPEGPEADLAEGPSGERSKEGTGICSVESGRGDAHTVRAGHGREGMGPSWTLTLQNRPPSRVGRVGGEGEKMDGISLSASMSSIKV